MSEQEQQPSSWKSELVDQTMMIGGSAIAGASMAMVDNMITGSAASSSTTGWSTSMLSYLAASALREKSETDKPTHWGIKSLFGTYWKMNAAMATYRLTETALSLFPDAFVPSMIKEVASASMTNIISGGEVARLLYTGLISTAPALALIPAGLVIAGAALGVGGGFAAAAASDEIQAFLAQMLFGETIGLITRAITDPGIKRFPPGTLITRTGKESYAESTINKAESVVLHGNKIYKSLTPNFVQTIASGLLEGLDLIGNKMPGRALNYVTNTLLNYFQPKNQQKAAVGYLHALASMPGKDIPEQSALSNVVSSHIKTVIDKYGGYDGMKAADKGKVTNDIGNLVFWKTIKELNQDNQIGEYDAHKNPNFGIISASLNLEIIRQLSLEDENSQGYVDYAKSFLPGSNKEAPPIKFVVDFHSNQNALPSRESGQIPAEHRVYDSYTTQLARTSTALDIQQQAVDKHEFEMPGSESGYLHLLRKQSLVESLKKTPAAKSVWIEPMPDYQFDPDGYTTRNPSLPPLAALDFANWVANDKGQSTIQSVMVHDDPRALPLAKQLGMEVLTVPTKNGRFEYHIQVRPRDSVKWSADNTLQQQISDGGRIDIPPEADQGKSNIERLREELAKPPAPHQQGITSYLYDKATTLAINAAYSVMKPAAMELTAMSAAVAIDWSRKKIKTAIIGNPNDIVRPATGHPKHKMAALTINELKHVQNTTRSAEEQERLESLRAFSAMLLPESAVMEVFDDETFEAKKKKRKRPTDIA